MRYFWKLLQDRLKYRKSEMSRIELNLNHSRYIDNPCPDDAGKLAKDVNEDWLKEQIKALTNTLVTRRVLPEECEEGGPYTGIGGVAYAIFRASSLLDGAPKDYYSNLCTRLLNSQLVNATHASQSRRSRYLTGTLGLNTIHALLLHAEGAPIDGIVEVYRSLFDVVLVPGYQKIGDDELMNGRAGYLTGILLLRMETGEPILDDAQLRKVLEAIIASGRAYSRAKCSDAPLMYQWHGSEYLGAAHGVSGIYQVLLSFWQLLAADERTDVLRSVDWYLTLQSAEGNFPSSSENRGDNELVHWCHGATGAIHMLITAYVVVGEAKYLEAAKRCTDVIWHRGLLRKGPGICHGVAGSGYAFILLHRLTGEPDYLTKAKAFAAVMLEPNFQKLARTPDAPYSLFVGWAGALCFLCDLLGPTDAQFPLVPIPFPDAFKASRSPPDIESASCHCAE